MTLDLDNRLGADGDRLYSQLIRAHEGLSTEQSQRLNVRLVLLLMNQVGDADIIEAALALARQTHSPASTET